MWAAGGALAPVLGALVLARGLPLAGDAALGAGIAPLVLGSVFLGYGLPRWWSRTRRAKRECTRQWQHAPESPGMTVEVLHRAEARHADDPGGWLGPTCAGARRVQ